MKGDGHHQEIIAKGKIRISIVRQEVAQRFCQTGVSPIFEPGDDFRHDALIMGEGSGLSEMPVSPETVRAQMILPERRWHSRRRSGDNGGGPPCGFGRSKRSRPPRDFYLPGFPRKRNSEVGRKNRSGRATRGSFLRAQGVVVKRNGREDLGCLGKGNGKGSPGMATSAKSGPIWLGLAAGGAQVCRRAQFLRFEGLLIGVDGPCPNLPGDGKPAP